MKFDNDNNYYNILGVPNNATSDDIKKAYRKMAFKYHPDRNSDNDDSNFKLVSEAYQILSDDRKRQVYDLGGYSINNYNYDYTDPFEMFNKSFNDNVNLFMGDGEYDDILRNFSNINFTDINKIFDTVSKSVSTAKNNSTYDFNTLFNFGMNAVNTDTKTANKYKNNNLVYNINISIKDLYNEVEKKVTIERTKKCKDGAFYTYKNKSKTYRISFYNRTVIFKNKGNETKHGKSDLILNVFAKENSGYRRIKENDLIKEFDIKISDIYNDYVLELIHLDNKKYYIQHTTKSFLDNGNLLFKIPSLGLPYKCKDVTKRGYLYIKYNLIFPSNINDITQIKEANVYCDKTNLNKNWLVAYNATFSDII